MGKLEAYAIIFIVFCISTAGAFYYGKYQGEKEERKEWQEKQALATKEDLESLRGAINIGNLIVQDVRDQLTKSKGTRVIERGVIEREIKTDVKYINDCFPESGRLQWNVLSAGRSLMSSSPSGRSSVTIMPDGISKPNK